MTPAEWFRAREEALALRADHTDAGWWEVWWRIDRAPTRHQAFDATERARRDLANLIAGAHAPREPRVWRDGDTVPPGVCVLNGDGEVEYLDDTADCRCDMDSDDGVCPDCSYEVINGNYGPLVEVILPDYHAVVARARTER